jgi:uncharacterized protein involved in exopolysaccharide biosynthesis
MNEAQTMARETIVVSKDEGISLVNALIVLAKHKKKMVGLPIAAAILSAVVSFALPDIYKASVKMLPPQQSQSSAAALLSQLGGVAGLAAGVGGIKNPNDLYVGMLKSRTVADQLITRYDLKRLYDTTSQEKARLKLDSDTSINAGKDGIITIDVESKDQNLVAKLANGYIDELSRLTKQLALTEAAQRRVFFERQLEQAKNKLADAEISLKKGLDVRGVINVDTESRAVIETGARIRAQISSKEVQLRASSAFLTPSNPEYRRTEEELASLRSQLSTLENGREKPEAGKAAQDTAPGAFDNIQLLRDVKYHQMLYELLAKQYEVARLDEAKDPTLIQTLDPAIEPEQKSKPHRILIIILSIVSGFIVAAIIAFLSELRANIVRSSAQADKWAQLRSYF